MTRKAQTSQTPPEPDGTGGKKSSLKVDPEDQRVISKVAAHRNLSIEDLFKEPDVRQFFRHLLLAEMDKEGKRLKGQS